MESNTSLTAAAATTSTTHSQVVSALGFEELELLSFMTIAGIMFSFSMTSINVFFHLSVNFFNILFP